jgi:hypothetical protein
MPGTDCVSDPEKWKGAEAVGMSCQTVIRKGVKESDEARCCITNITDVWRFAISVRRRCYAQNEIMSKSADQTSVSMKSSSNRFTLIGRAILPGHVETCHQLSVRFDRESHAGRDSRQSRSKAGAMLHGGGCGDAIPKAGAAWEEAPVCWNS